MKLRALLVGKLVVQFLKHCVLSGISTAWIILQPGERPPAGLVRVSFAPMSESGAALLGAMVTLTPGSSVLDIDLEKREMLMHLLDVRGADATVRAIRADFEPAVVGLFPAELRAC